MYEQTTRFVKGLGERVDYQIELHRSAGYGLTPMFESYIPALLKINSIAVVALLGMKALGDNFSTLKKFSEIAGKALEEIENISNEEIGKMNREDEA
jgi:hypothetical protein